MKILVSIKCMDDDGNVIEEGNFPRETAVSLLLDKGTSDLEKAHKVLQAFSEIAWQLLVTLSTAPAKKVVKKDKRKKGVH